MNKTFQKFVEKYRNEGVLIGRNEGVLIGRSEGVLIGRNEGVLQNSREIARRMHDKGLSLDKIAEFLGFSPAEIQGFFLVDASCEALASSKRPAAFTSVDVV